MQVYPEWVPEDLHDDLGASLVVVGHRKKGHSVRVRHVGCHDSAIFVKACGELSLTFVTSNREGKIHCRNLTRGCLEAAR
jgi:hypothetical protein